MLESSIKEKFEILGKIIQEAVSEDGRENPDKVAEFSSLLHADNDAFMDEDYDFNSYQLLCMCIDNGARDIANILIDAKAELERHGQDILNAACATGLIDLYNQAEQAILKNPEKYKKMHHRLMTGDCYHSYLASAIRFGQIDAIEMLLKKYQTFYQKYDSQEKSPVNLLFAIGGFNLDKAGFIEAYKMMLALGYKDINFKGLADHMLKDMLQSMIKWKDKKHLVQLLNQGKDFCLVNKNYQSPQDLIKSGYPVDEVALAILNESIREENININDIHEKLDHLLSDIQNEGVETPEKIEEFKKLLHTGNDCFMRSNYDKNSAELLSRCIDGPFNHIASILIDANASFQIDEYDLLEKAALMGRVTIYKKMEQKVKDLPAKYLTQSKDLKSGENFHKYLRSAIRFGEIKFVKMLLENYTKFYQAHDANELAPVNILFEEGLKLKEMHFFHLYQHMLKLGYHDVNFDVDHERLERMMSVMIKSKDITHIKQMLAQGKDISFVNKDYLSPQELIKAGASLDEVAEGLLKNEISYNEYKMLPFEIENLNPDDVDYSDYSFEDFSATQKSEIRAKLIALLPTIPLGNTNLDPDIESQVYGKIHAFLNKPDPLYLKNLDRSQAAIQLLRMFRNPECLDQGESTLCGVATFCQMLIDKYPLYLLDEMLIFCETGKTNNPYFFSTAEKIKKETNVFQAFIKAFKNTHSTYGYHRNHPLIENLTGGTKSKSLVGWMEAFGFKDIIDTWILTDPKNKEATMVHRGVLGGLYSKHHKTLKKSEDRFIELLKAYEEGKVIALCIGPTLAAKGEGCNSYLQNTDLKARQEFMEEFIMLGIVTNHWVYLKEIHYDELKNEVRLKYFTYGKVYDCTLSKENFLTEFNGMVAALAPPILTAKAKPSGLF